MRESAFTGSSVFLSRNLVAPEVYDAVLDALRLNGAQVFLCCDPSRNSPSDYHVISSADHEKFEVLRAKGCNLLGPQCVLYCAKEKRHLPRHGYTCCLAMEGVQVLTSGFQKKEKVQIEKVLSSMGGILGTKTTMDVNFVVVKNVLAPKYKWALNVLKKPIVNLNWLYQCGIEHRIVPHDPYRILPFTGLTICITKLTTEERTEMKQLIQQNGGKYSADLTKDCTHLISAAPEGDKYKVARRWGNIHIVCRRWIDQSICRRACLDEIFYRVDSIPRNCFKSSEKVVHNQVSEATMSAELEPPESILSQNMASSTCSDPSKTNSEGMEAPSLQKKDDNDFICQMAEDSESDDNDLYLSNCRIALLGFDARELSKQVNLIRKGGGSRHISLTEKLTHIIIGSSPTEIEKKEVRHLAAWGVINVVKPAWLLECDQFKKDVSVLPRHVVSELLIPRGSVTSGVEPPSNLCDDKEGKYFNGFETNSLLGKRRGSELDDSNSRDSCFAVFSTSRKSANSETNHQHEKQLEPGSAKANMKLSSVFSGKAFSFSSSFPLNKRGEVIEWIRQGGGVMMDNRNQKIEHFLIENHGSFRAPTDLSHSTIISSHWIRFCLEEGSIQDISSHVLFSPLSCRVPLPGFKKLRFCVSQYGEKDRMLLRNLCHTLGATFTKGLSKSVTHLLCKYRVGEKYEAACKYSIESVRADWIIECVKQDTMVPLDAFRPKQLTDKEKKAGLCTTSQYPTQAAHIFSVHASSDLPNTSQRYLESQEVYKDTLGNDVVERDVAEAIEDLLAQSTKMQDMSSPGTSRGDKKILLPQHSILESNRTGHSSTFEFSRPWLNSNQKQEDNPGLGHGSRHTATFDAFSETQTDSQVVGYEEDLSGRQKIIDRVRSQGMNSSCEK